MIAVRMVHGGAGMVLPKLLLQNNFPYDRHVEGVFTLVFRQKRFSGYLLSLSYISIAFGQFLKLRGF